MSNPACSDLISKGDMLKIYDVCHNLECICRKQVTFNARQFQLERSGFKKNEKNIQRDWKNVE